MPFICHRLALLTVCAALLWTSVASAENFTRSGEYVVHHSAMTTADLPASVARAYGLTRSRGRALVNLNVQSGGLSGNSVPFTATGTAKSLTGVERTLTFRVIEEDGAIYAIATAAVANLETVRFDLEVTPSGERTVIPVRFVQKFFR